MERTGARFAGGLMERLRGRPCLRAPGFRLMREAGPTTSRQDDYGGVAVEQGRPRVPCANLAGGLGRRWLRQADGNSQSGGWHPDLRDRRRPLARPVHLARFGGAALADTAELPGRRRLHDEIRAPGGWAPPWRTPTVGRS